VQALYRDWGLEMDLVVASDSSAARGTASRRGLGKLRQRTENCSGRNEAKRSRFVYKAGE